MNGLTLEPKTKIAAEKRLRRMRIIFAYVTIFCALPVLGFWQAFIPVDPATLVWIQVGLLALLLVAAHFWPPTRALRGFVFIALMVTLITSVLIPLVANSTLWQGWFNVPDPSFQQANSGAMLLKLGATVLVIAVLLLMGLRRADFYLVNGHSDALVAPVGPLGKKSAVPWTKFGRNFALVCFMAILAVTLLPLLPDLGLGVVVEALPLIPAALLFAAANGIFEEVVYRASFLSQLAGVVGAGHALVITILFFGLGHLTGSVPSGIVGVVLASFFAIIMGTAMLETGGMTWPWICHFAADAAVFIFLAVLTSAGMV